MPKLDLNSLIASLLSLFFTPKGLLVFLLGLALGFLIAVSPFLVVGLLAILGIMLYAFRDKIDFKKIKALARANPPSPPPLPPPPDEKKEEKKTEEKKTKKIIIELE